MIGIYQILNQCNGKVYIGQSVNIARRWSEHITGARNINEKRNYNMPIHAAMRKYGTDNFIFSVLEECTAEELNDKERYWIAVKESTNKEKGYNIATGGRTNRVGLGENHSQVKLTQEEVNFIKECLRQQMSPSEIVKKINYKVSKNMIHQINLGHNWFVQDETYPIRTEKTIFEGEKNPNVKLTQEQVMEIRKLYAEGMAPSVIYNEYCEKWHMKERTLRAALYGESWKNLPKWDKNKKEWI